MINIYKTDDSEKINAIKDYESNSWIDLIEPTMEEIDEVSNRTNISKNLLIKLLDVEELPRIETADESTLIVVDFIYVADHKSKHKYSTLPLGIITNAEYLVTIASKEPEVLSDIKLNKIKHLYTHKKTRFIIQLLSRNASLYLKYLNSINKEIETKEKLLVMSTKNKELISLMNIQKSLVYFFTSLKANNVLLEKLAKGNVLNLYDEDLDLLEDAIIENTQGVETANIYREIISSMTDTYATIISNNLNEIMKFLAGITIVFSIPTMIASFMGMNVPLGIFNDHPLGFIIIVGISLLIALIIGYILKKKDML